MSKKTIVICDDCGNEIDSNGAGLRVTYTDARRGAKAADLCGDCADKLPGRSVKRRGRPPRQEE